MPLQSSSFEETKLKPNERIQIKDSLLAPEKQFEPWISSVEPSNTSYFTRNYGWDEIEQNEDETKQLRQLLSIWDAERIAILKLQHDLDKNIFQRTFDYIKRIGQSIGLALWLWVHRPANCSNISNLHHQQQYSFPLVDSGEDFICSNIQNNPILKVNDDQKRQEYIDTLPDSLWLKHFVLDETEEYLPPIARAMKNMLDHNTVICNSENLQENVWPYFINQTRAMQNNAFLRNMHQNNVHQSPPSPSLPIYTIDKKKPNIKITDTNAKPTIKIEQHSPATAVQQNIDRSKSKKKSRHLTSHKIPRL